ncbi:hypothetical protein [Xenorhabdus stockiae]|uniref:hypothetical protein n=1 Tax=Xenorhabdus stockiae TaxID=351614 RepID=UPI004062EA7F
MTALLFFQIFNALFYGIFIGLGVTIIQDIMPKRSGFSSAFYSNAMRVGMMSGTSLAGVVAQIYNFKIALLVPILSISLASILLLWVSITLLPNKSSELSSTDV